MSTKSLSSRSLGDPEHPVWDFGRFAIVMISATLILWVNANDFDITEERSLLMLAGAVGGWSGIERFLRGKSKTND